MRGILVFAILFLLPFASALTSLSSCTNISYSDEFVLAGNIVGNQPYPPYSISACIYIYNSDVTIDCAGNSILGNESGSGYGIWISDSLRNVTIKNCTIGNFSSGVHFYTNVNNTLITNNTIFNTGTGIFLNPGDCNDVISNNYMYDNGVGVQLGYDTDLNNMVANNTAYNGTGYGFVISGVNNTLINNSAIKNVQSGIWAVSYDSSYINNTVSSNSFAGIYVSSGSNNTFSGTVSSSNSRGFYVSGAANNTFLNSTAFNNSNGFELISGSSGNRFIDSIAYGGSGYGVAFNQTTFGNNFTNTFIYNQTSYLYQQATAPGPNNFFNMTLGYNRTIGLVNYAFLNVTGADLGAARFRLRPDWVSLDAANVPQANVSANITLNTSDCGYVVLKKTGFPTSFGDIFTNGAEYPTTLSCASGIATFSASSFSGYALGPAPAITNINSCSDLSIPNKVYNLTANTGCPGVCSCMNINASNVTLQCNGFSIDGTALSFVSYGVNISSVENITIRDCDIRNFFYGVYLSNSRFSNISNNSIALNEGGVSLSGNSDNNTVQGNTITCLGFAGNGININGTGTSNFNRVIGNRVSSSQWGIFLESPDNNLTGNNLSGNLEYGLVVRGTNSIPCRNYIDESNAAGDSGGPILFRYDTTGITVENSASYGEVLLCNVSNSVVRNMTVAGGDGIILASGSNGNQVYNNSVSGAWYGYQVYNSSGDTLFNNTASSNQYGFEINYLSTNNVVCNNSIISNAAGLEATSSTFNYFCNSAISAASGGVVLQNSYNNTIRNITVDPAPNYGMVVYYSHDNNVSGFAANISAGSYGAGIYSGGATLSSGNIFSDITIYTINLFGIEDVDGKDTYINTYIHSSSNNFTSAFSSPSTFTNLTLAKDGSSVNFPGTFPMANGSNYTDTSISSDFVSIDSSKVPELNRSANVTTYTNDCSGAKIYSLAGFPSSRSSIISGGSECLLCSILSCAGNVTRFYVPDFTGYAAGAPSGCVNLSDPSTWSGKIVNDSATGTLYFNQNTTLCTGYYYRDVPGMNRSMHMNASNIYLDCNGSVIDGVDDAGVGLHISGVENDTIRNCTFKDYAFGFYVQGFAKNNLFVYDNATSSLDYGFSIESSCDGNTILYSTASAPTGNNYAFQATGNVLRHSTAYGGGVGALVQGSGNVVDNLTAVGPGSFGVYLGSASGCSVENSTISGYTYGIYADSSNSNRIAYNGISGAGTAGIYSTNSNSNTFRSNTVHDNAGTGVYLYGSSYNAVSGSSAYNNTRGFVVDTGSSNNLTNNIAYNNPEVGFHIFYSNYSTMINNSAYSNGMFGLGMGFSIQSSHSIFFNNSAHDNSWNGFYISYSEGNSFANSLAYGNSMGFQIYLSNNNAISNLTVHSNGGTAVQVTGDGSTNAYGNNFTDTVAYNNTGYGVLVWGVGAGPSQNLFTNTFIYSQGNYMRVMASDPNNFTNLTLGYNATAGLINYPSMNVTTGVDLQEGNDIYIRPDWVSLDPSDSDADDMDVPAFITINNSNCASTGVLRDPAFSTSLNGILLNGLHYPATKVCNGDLATFNVSGFSGYTLGQEQTYLTLTSTPPSPMAYGNSLNVSCSASNSEVLLEILRNGTSIAGPTSGYVEYAGTLTAGYYNFTCNASGTGNYTAAEESALYTINKATPSVTFNADPGWSIRPNTAVNVSCEITVPGLTIELWRDAALIGSGTYAEEAWTPTATGSYAYTCNTTGNENYTSFSSTQTLSVRTPSTEGGEPAEVQLFIIAPDEVPQSSEMTIVVQKEGEVNMPLAKVVITTGGSVVFAGTTDTWGRVFFTPTSTGTYFIAATRSGFVKATDSFEVIAPAPECASDENCAYNEACVSGNCTMVPPGECGAYASHAWADYACCADSGCAAGFTCTNHECVKKEVPPTEGRCTSDSQCGAGYTCSGGMCALIPRPECMNANDCLPGFECRSGSCIRKPVAPPTEEVIPGGEGVEGEGKGILADISNVALRSAWLVLLFMALALIWFFFYRKRKKKGAEALLHAD